MQQRLNFLLSLAVLACAACPPAGARAWAQEDPETAQIRAGDEAFVKAFNSGKIDELVAMFLPKGELIDDEGNVFQGQAEIKELLTRFFEKFPGAKLSLEIESIRVVGPVAIEEGTRYIATQDDSAKAQLRYVNVRAKTNLGWQVASIREFKDDPSPSPHEQLQPLAWLVGDWVNEGSDAVVKISYRWSADKNFLLGDFTVTREGRAVMNSSQRLGWDPLVGKVRAWLFDSDGGFGGGHWTFVEDSWVFKSSAVLPDAQTGSATITITPQGADRFTMKGTDRLVADTREADFEVTVARRPPAPGK
jgi:ketosteroid isomerase-like protein